jgi:hypothetical protein
MRVEPVRPNNLGAFGEFRRMQVVERTNSYAPRAQRVLRVRVAPKRPFAPEKLLLTCHAG